MRYACLLLLLVVGAPALAQTSPAARPDTVVDVLPATAPDTAAAIHRLFVARRKRQAMVIGGTVAASFLTIAVVAATQQSPAPTHGSGGSFVGPFTIDPVAVAGVGALILTPPLILTEVLLFGGWGRKEEHRVIKAWQQHQLPAFYKRKLKPKYFQPPQKQR